MIGGVHGLGVSKRELEAAKTALEQQIQESKETLTAEDVGAAAAVHKHSASDMTSGTLPVARGGTGVASLTGTDYTTQRVRGISFHANEAPANIPNGGMVGIYELA